MSNNWYYFYDKRGIDEKDLKVLALNLENLGYRYHQPMGLGAGPSPEQIILWIHNNQFVTGVSIGVVSNLLYDILKSINTWFKNHRYKSDAIPIVEFFISFRNDKSLRTRGQLKFRIDQSLDKPSLKKSIKSQIEILHSSSNKDLICYFCKKVIYHYTGFYLKRSNLRRRICQDCLNKMKYKAT